MLKKMLIALAVILFASTNGHAKLGFSAYYTSLGFDSLVSIPTSSMFGVIGAYEEGYDLEFGLGHSSVSNPGNTADGNVLQGIVNASLKSPITDKTSFTYGGSIYWAGGEVLNSASINSAVGFGAFVGIQNMLDESLVLNARYYPIVYSISSTKTNGVISDDTTNTQIGTNVSIGISYLAD